MKTISQSEYEEILASGRPDDVKFGYPSMIYHPDGMITKIWANPVKLFSSARLKPYAKRFVDNAAKIRSWGIETPEILDYFKIENTHVHLVRYQPLPGKSIRDLLGKSPAKIDVNRLSTFILNLHDDGIFFRTIHFGNVIQLDDDRFGLIDFCDISRNDKPLSVERRAVNLAVPMKYQDDMAAMERAGMPRLHKAYLKVWQPDSKARESFLKHLDARLERFR